MSDEPLNPEQILAALSEPFEAAEVKCKPAAVSGNRALALFYVDARVVQDRLDDVLGLAGWQDDYECKEDGSVICRLRLRLGAEWIQKVDVGGPSEQPDGGDRLKAAFSDALKRAAVKFGVGRYLYRVPQQWVDYDPQKRAFKTPPAIPVFSKPDPPQQKPAQARTETPAQFLEVLARSDRRAQEKYGYQPGVVTEELYHRAREARRPEVKAWSKEDVAWGLAQLREMADVARQAQEQAALSREAAHAQVTTGEQLLHVIGRLEAEWKDALARGALKENIKQNGSLAKFPADLLTWNEPQCRVALGWIGKVQEQVEEHRRDATA